MRFLRSFAVAALVASPLTVQSQTPDSLRVGDRVRVRIAATRGTNVFVGDVASLSPDTLVLSIPGGKGSITLPRLAISEVARSDGRQSRLRTNLLPVAPLLFGTALIATAPTMHGRAAGTLNAERYLSLGLSVFIIGHAFSRTPPERWRPVYDWLDRR